MKRVYLCLLAALAALTACRETPSEGWKPTNLLAYGIPLSIMAPEGAEITRRQLGGVIDDVTVKGLDGYHLQIFAADAETNDLARLKAIQLADIKTSRYFSRVVEEEQAGFIYETRLDGNLYYSFRYIHLQGDREYVFQPGLTELYSLEEAQRLYKAAKPLRR
jgi:hypothetical protein